MVNNGKFSLMEHDPWVGSGYETGIEGQRIAIIGFSHHNEKEEGEDRASFSKEVVEDVITGEERYAFFTQIRNYFGFDDHSNFWNRVMFFNYLPECVGSDDERYGYGTEEQHILAKDRFLRLIRMEYPPHKVLVFTVKGWEACPPTREEELEDGVCRPLGADFPGFTYGTYDANGQIVMAFRLRHPQGANGELMRRAIQHILAMPNYA